MEKFETTRSQIIPLPLKDVDTDMIIPAQYLTSVSREGYGQWVFKRLRDSDPQFPFNDTAYRDSKILVADSNFGCGSSREHAVWALYDWGIRVVIAPSFSDIFFSNSAKNGLLLVTIDQAEVDPLLQLSQTEPVELSVSLVDQCILLPDGREIGFEYDPFRKHCLLEGLDDLDYIRSHHQDIKAFFEGRENVRFFDSTKPNREQE